MDDTPTNPIHGEDHHNQILGCLALTDTSGQIRFGATAIDLRTRPTAPPLRAAVDLGERTAVVIFDRLEAKRR